MVLPEPAAVVAITDGRLCIIHQGERALTVKGQRVMRFRGYNKSFDIAYPTCTTGADALICWSIHLEVGPRPSLFSSPADVEL